MPGLVTERVVTYWAVDGDRWCNCTGMVTEKMVEEWSGKGWRFVTRITERPAQVFGELEEREE